MLDSADWGILATVDGPATPSGMVEPDSYQIWLLSGHLQMLAFEEELTNLLRFASRKASFLTG